MAIAVELQPERAPSGHPQVAQPQLLVDEVEVVMQTLARVRLEKRFATLLVVPRLVALARFHGRDHVHQPRMITTLGEHLGDHVLLANVRLVDVLDGHARHRRRFHGRRTNAIAQRLGKARVVKDADAARVQKARHPLRVTRPRQRACNDHPVVAGQHAHQPLAISLRQHLRHRRLRLLERAAVTLSCLVPALPA